MMTARRKTIWSVLVTILLLLFMEFTFRLGYRSIAGEQAYLSLIEYAQGPPAPPAMHFIAYPDYFYANDSREPGVNRLGFWGPDPTTERQADELRVVLIGDSTVAGAHGYAPALQRILAAQYGRPVQVAQLAMPGWTLRECALAARAVLPQARPDAVVVHAGANDLAAASFAGLRDDYRHWRRESFGDTGEAWRVLRWRHALLGRSRLAAFTARYMGYPPSTPPNLNQLANRPELRSLPKADYGEAFEHAVGVHLQSIVDAGRQAGAKVVLTTQPYCLERIGQAGWRESMREGMTAVATVIEHTPCDALVDLSKELAGNCPTAFRDMIHVEPGEDQRKAEMTAAALVGILPPQ